MTRSLWRLLPAVASSLCITTPALAQSDWGVVINGHSIHLNAERRWNEQNWGLGVEREFNSDGRWVGVALANGFKDSVDEPSYMAGGGLKRRFMMFDGAWHVDVGVVGFLMTRQDVDHNRPFPGALPALTVGSKRIAVNVTYTSDKLMDRATNAALLDPAITGILFIQLRLDASLLGLGHRAARDD
jgi:hypothetical protein